jgi:hypothetical protein
MAIAVRCSCGRQFRAKEDHAGRRTRCPACSAGLVIAGEHLPDHDVFVSYSSKDKPVADAVCARLEERRIRCWVAPRDIRPGMDWSSAIIDAIADSAVLVLLFTGNSNQSPQVLREVERAVNKGVAILPLRLEETGLSKSMEYFISASHWLDAIAPPLEQHLEELVTTIKAILNRRKMGASEAPAGPTAAAAATPISGRALAGVGQPLLAGAGVAPALPSQAQPGVGGRPRRPSWVVGASALLLLSCAGIVVWSVVGGWWGSRRGHEGTANNTRPPPASAPATAPGRVVNLLPLIDIADDTVSGHWRFEDGRLISDGSAFARIRVRYDPPPEYDFRIEFVRLEGSDDVVQMVNEGGRRCAWQMAGGYGREWAFDAILGRKVVFNPHPRLSNGQRHTSIVRVRHDGISAFFDGKLAGQVQAKSSDLSLPVRWSLLGGRGLGLGSAYSRTVFYTAEVTEIGDAIPATAPATQSGR